MRVGRVVRLNNKMGGSTMRLHKLYGVLQVDREALL